MARTETLIIVRQATKSISDVGDGKVRGGYGTALIHVLPCCHVRKEPHEGRRREVLRYEAAILNFPPGVEELQLENSRVTSQG